MKKKTCFWLNSKQKGAMYLIHGSLKACCLRGIVISDENDVSYHELSYDQIQEKRMALYNRINNGGNDCNGCSYLCEREEDDIEIGKIGLLLYLPHKTCILRCCYCPFVKNNAVSEVLDNEKYNPYRDIVHFFNIGLLKENALIEFGGGEPLLLDTLPEAIEYISENHSKCTVRFVSNFVAKKPTDKLLNVLEKRKMKAVLRTSVDCGTRETYKKIRGRDFWNNLRENLIKAAQMGAFDDIQLKYILLEDGSNSSKKDIDGFIELAKEIKALNPHKTTVVIDADKTTLWNSNYKEDDLPKRILRVASKIYAKAKYDLNLSIDYGTGRFISSSPNGKIYIKECEKGALFTREYCLYVFKKIKTIFNLL